jgi:hypothetical protein
MRLEVDWTRCDGHGLCALLLPEHLHADTDGYPIDAPCTPRRRCLPGARTPPRARLTTTTARDRVPRGNAAAMTGCGRHLGVGANGPGAADWRC